MRTPEVIQSLLVKCQGLISFHSSTNLGKGVAVSLGIISSGELITVQDANMELDPKEYSRLINPLLTHEFKVVYGSRFLNLKVKLRSTALLANRILTLLTNLLYGFHLADMKTAYNLFFREVMDGIGFRWVRLDFVPEITDSLLLQNHDILEVPNSYTLRTMFA